MSTTHKGAKILALLAGGSLALAACSTGGEGGDDPTSSAPEAQTKDITITVAHEQEFSAYNNGTSQDNAVKNTVVLNQVQTGFWEFGEDGTVVPTEEFGTYEKTSDDPLTVEYKINPDAAWSDGEAIDCDDIMLIWAANSGNYDTGEGDAATIMFDTASTAGFELMEKPTCADGDKDFTIVYTDSYSDWIAGVCGILPAHIAETEVRRRGHRRGRRGRRHRLAAEGRRLLEHRLALQPGRDRRSRSPRPRARTSSARGSRVSRSPSRRTRTTGAPRPSPRRSWSASSSRSRRRRRCRTATSRSPSRSRTRT